MTEEAKKSFVVRCKQFFELLPGQSLSEFSAELKTLTAADKLEFARLFNEAGLPTLAPRT